MDHPTPWTCSFSDTAGYDCMTGGWYISDANGDTICVIDQANFGQDHCDWDYRSPEAEQVARAICQRFA